MNSNLQPRQFTTTMRPSQLLQFAQDRSDKFGQAKINVLADSISQHGYRADQARGNKAPITLEHDPVVGSSLTEGNHRVHAMNRIGYDRPVRVKVVDYRGAK